MTVPEKMQIALEPAAMSSHLYQADIRFDIPKDAEICRELAVKTRERRHAAVLAAAQDVFVKLSGMEMASDSMAVLLDSSHDGECMSYRVNVLGICAPGRRMGLTVDRRNRISDCLVAFASVESAVLRVSVNTRDYAYLDQAAMELVESEPKASNEDSIPFLPEAAMQYVSSLHAGAVRSVRLTALPSDGGTVDFDVCVDSSRAA